MKKVFIDGSAGTTGLRILERLSQRNDIELIRLSEELRKDTRESRHLMKVILLFSVFPMSLL